MRVVTITKDGILYVFADQVGSILNVNLDDAKVLDGRHEHFYKSLCEIAERNTKGMIQLFGPPINTFISSEKE